MIRNNTLFFVLCGTLAFGVACGDDDGAADTGTDTATDTPTVDAPMADTAMDVPVVPDAGPDPDPTCENLCDLALTTCAGDAAAFANMTECMSWCNDIGAWDAGTAGDDSGNTIACRIRNLRIATPDCNAAGFTGGGVCGTYCENYCGNIGRTCEGSDAVYANAAECMTMCGDIDDDGVPGTTSGDSIQCRIYHAGVPADMMPVTHCPHAGPTGLDAGDGSPVCAFDPGGFDFREDDPSAFTRDDRMGMPAVSTVLAGGPAMAAAAAYNDGNPSNDAALDYAAVVIANLTALHGALDDDFEDIAGITPCSMDPSDPGDPDSLPVCLAQTVGDGGPSVVSLVVPDTITVDASAAAGFPNGRLLTDPVIDVTLSIIFLDLTVNEATTLVGTNPTANDVAFLDEFPYLAPAN